MSTLLDHPKAPTCQCCGGDGTHEYHSVIGAASPYDVEEDCTNCHGQGVSWFTARPNSCGGARSLRGHE
jgi:DnaJ-class molecular chaperone